MSRWALTFGLIGMLAAVLWWIGFAGPYNDIVKWIMYIFAVLFVVGLFIRDKGVATPPPPTTPPAE